jgi:hypothetical protein
MISHKEIMLDLYIPIHNFIEKCRVPIRYTDVCYTESIKYKQKNVRVNMFLNWTLSSRFL